MGYQRQNFPFFRHNLGVVVFTLAGFIACGTEEPGVSVPAGWDVLPSPNSFARVVHPLLVDSCAAAACHGRKTTLSLHRPTTPGSGPDVSDPAELPPPYREDYFNVLVFCDPQNEAESALLRFGSGEVASHPGGSALTVVQRGTVRDWIEGRP